MKCILSSIADVAASLNCFESIVQIVSGGEQNAVVGRMEVDECRKKQRGKLFTLYII
jgi:hypothetical protein